jgi:hypothetical protein
MINSLDNSNPTKLLLEAIRKCGMDMETSGSFKDDEEFCLATVHNGKVSAECLPRILDLIFKEDESNAQHYCW